MSDKVDELKEFREFTGRPKNSKVLTNATPKYTGELAEKLRRSNLKLFVNPNISYKTLDNNGQIKLGQKLIEFREYLKENIEKIQKKHPTKPLAKLISLEGSPEVGPNKAFGHIMMAAVFDGFCWIDKPKFKQLADKFFGRSCHVDSKFYKDEAAIVDAYVKKATDDFEKGHAQAAIIN